MTQNHTLYPILLPEDVPIKEHSDYNVTVVNNGCESNVVNVTVTLSILLNDNVLRNVPYIMCKIERTDSGSNGPIRRKSDKVYLQRPTTVQPTVQPTHTSWPKTSSMPCVTCTRLSATALPTPSAECRPYLHFYTSLCIVTSLLYLFMF